MKTRKKRPVGRPPESSDENIKEKILQSFLEICFREGIESVTLQKVADHSGVALTSVRYHFQIKGLSLSQVALDYISNRTFQWINEQILEDRKKPKFDPVMSYIRVQFDAAEAFPMRASFLVYFYYLCTTSTKLPFNNIDQVQNARIKILGLINEGLGMKIYQYKGDPALLAEQIHSLAMGAFIIAVTSRDPKYFQLQKENCMNLASQMLRSQHLNK